MQLFSLLGLVVLSVFLVEISEAKVRYVVMKSGGSSGTRSYNGNRRKTESISTHSRHTSASKLRSSLPKNPGQVYFLRKKVVPQVPIESISLTEDHHSSNINPITSSSSGADFAKEFSMPILKQQQSLRREDPAIDFVSEIKAEPADWVSLEQAYAINKAIEHHRSRKQPFTITNIQLEEPSSEEYSRTPIMVDGSRTGSVNNFRSNIPLPQNPFMSVEPQEEKISMSVYATPSKEQAVQDMLNKYLETIHGPGSIDSPNSRADSVLSRIMSRIRTMPRPSVHVSDSYYSESSKEFAKRPKPYYESHSSHHHFKSSSKYAKKNKHHHVKVPPTEVTTFSESDFINKAAPDVYSMAKALSEQQHLREISEVFPPPGSYTPYGERTIIMMRFPALPSEKTERGFLNNIGVNMRDSAAGFGGLRAVSLPTKNWQFASSRSDHLEKPADFGVIISQNYILQPDTSVNSHYNSEGSTSRPADMLPELAKALAHSNNLVNSYASGSASKGQNSRKPPFVLVHLESFTKKKNVSTAFGFDELIETNFANGTIIYPTMEDPDILASTNFEFDTLGDLETLFDKPLHGHVSGGIRPVIPLGLPDILNYLRLMHEVHKDIHEGGRVKVEELKGLSHVVDRQKLPGSRTMEEYEKAKANGRYRNNWLHTSTIGIRSLSDIPPPPPKLPVPYPVF